MDSRFQLEILQNKLCSGCGVCTSVNGALKVDFDDEGQLIASYNPGAEEGLEAQVCPFSDSARDEDVIGRNLFGDLTHAPFVGYYRGCYVGYVSDPAYRDAGASGGFGRWLCSQLLLRGEVDYVVHVEAAPEEDRLFRYAVTDEPSRLLNTARSAYYPVSMDEALKFILENPGRYAITAVPCFAKALRNLADVNPIIADRIKYIIGIICGHLKTTNFANALALQVGVQPPDVSAVDFRYKMPGNRANEKGFVAFSKNGEKTEAVNTRSLIGGDWGLGFFKYKACDYCDDVIAETADIAIGDAWLPQFMDDSKGHSVLVVRNSVIQDIIDDGMAQGAVALDATAPDVVVRSQAGGIRHRNEGLAQRLYDDQRAGRFAPKKRVKPARLRDLVQRYVFRYRVESRECSRYAVQNSVDENGVYQLDRLVGSLSNLQRRAKPPLAIRLAARVQRTLPVVASRKGSGRG